MKLIVPVVFLFICSHAMAFDFKGLVEKAAKDEKMQAQAKDLAKKGYDYFQGNKEEKKEEVPTQDKTKEEPKKL